MGWSIDLIADKGIAIEDVQELVDNLSERYKSSFGLSKQSWGWNACCDINRPESNKLWLSGSYGLSGDIAEEFARYMKDELVKKKYDVELVFRW